jgi:hypothetical protein
MSTAFHHSLDHVALNLDLRRPRTAASHLRSAFRHLYRLNAPDNLPPETGPWLNQSLVALSRADYRKAGIFLSEVTRQLPPTPSNQLLIEQLTKLQFSLEQNELPEAAQCLRAFNDAMREFRRNSQTTTDRPA